MNLHLRASQIVLRGLCALCILALPVAAQWDDSPGEVPYVPTPQQVVEGMLKLAEVKTGDLVMDLGCGDGRIVVTAVKKFGAAKGVGVDINPERIKDSEETAKQEGVTEKVQFILKNLFDADVHAANVVTLYLLPDVNMRLRPKLLKDLKVGSRIVSHAFDMGDWKPDKQIDVDGRRVYLWRVTQEAKAQFAN